MSRKELLEIILVIVFWAYTAVQSVSSYSTISRHTTLASASPVVQKEIKLTAKEVISSNVVMAWSNKEGKVGHHILSAEEFNRLQKMARTMPKEKLNEFFNQAKSVETKQFVTMINRTEDMRIARLSP